MPCAFSAVNTASCCASLDTCGTGDFVSTHRREARTEQTSEKGAMKRLGAWVMRYTDEVTVASSRSASRADARISGGSAVLGDVGAKRTAGVESVTRPTPRRRAAAGEVATWAGGDGRRAMNDKPEHLLRYTFPVIFRAPHLCLCRALMQSGRSARRVLLPSAWLPAGAPPPNVPVSKSSAAGFARSAEQALRDDAGRGLSGREQGQGVPVRRACL